MPQRANRFWTIFLSVVLVDVATKRFAVTALTPYVPRNILDDVLRFTLAFNSGGAMSLSLGPASRWWFTLLSLATLVVLAYMYRQSSPGDKVQIASLALICGGAVGNLIDRVRSPRGVVDFIDIGIGSHRFWTFNIADMAVTIGTATLTWILCTRGTSDERRSPVIPATGQLDEPN
ncbi:MAG: Lipoprotein signal peptidase [Gemmatimonadales bacterium]|jgi:signal peptidase II|nr:Lipoprotein signal peptidase [Gemmatimonadales bacterium]